MKIIFVTLALFAVSTANPIVEWKVPSDSELQDVIYRCIMSNINLPMHQIQTCGIKCAFEKTGIFDETNGFNVEHVIKVEMQNNGRTESDARTVAEKCAIQKGPSESNCDWASRGMTCLRDLEVKKTKN